MTRVVEFIRGLGLGGAEALMVHRLSSEKWPNVTATVVNVFPAQDHWAARLRQLGCEVVTPRTASPVSAIVCVFREARRAGQGAILVSHSPMTSLVLKARRLVGGGRRQRIVDVVHNANYRLPYIWVGYLLNPLADLAICVGEEVATSRTTARYRRKTVVHGGVDAGAMTDWLAAPADGIEELRAEMGASPDQRVAVCVGGLSTVKNHDLAVRASCLLGADWRLAIIGEGAMRAHLQEVIEQSRAPAVLLGSRAAAWRYIAAADVLLHTSKYEGIPVVLMEASVVGTPVVATNFEGAREIARSGAEVEICAPDAAVLAAAARAAGSQLRRQSTYWSSERYAAEFFREISR